MPRANKITVALITHNAYLPYLPKAVDAINNQTTAPRKKILVYDGDEFYSDADLEGWDIILLPAGKPNPLRNAAVDACKTSWLIFVDGDDYMAPDYVEHCNSIVGRRAVDQELGFVYNDIQYSDGSKLETPAQFDYWALRRGNYVSSTACWNKGAIKEVGGWSKHTKCYDDWSLALGITRAGYYGVKGPGTIMVNNHGHGHRRTTPGNPGNKQFGHFWHERSYGIVTLFAGRMHLIENHFRWLKAAHDANQLPPHLTVYQVDNSKSKAFTDRLKQLQDDCPVECVMIQDDSDHDNRHTIVSRLYSKHLPRIKTDFLVMLEDDVVPPVKGLAELAREWNNHNKPAGISGIYLSRHNKQRKWGLESFIVASNHRSHWGIDIKLKDVIRLKNSLKQGYRRAIPVRQIAGGFTLWNNGIVQPSLPVRYGKYGPTDTVIGWDSDLSFKAAAMGHRCFLHLHVYCDHKYR